MKANIPSNDAVFESSNPRQLERSVYSVTEGELGQGLSPDAHLIPAPGWIAGEDSGKSIRIVIARADQRVVATALVTPAEESLLLRRSPIPRQALARCAFVSDVATDGEVAQDLLAGLLYSCARRGRIWDHTMLITGKGAGAIPESRTVVRFEPLSGFDAFDVSGQGWVPSVQRLDIGTHQAWMAASPAMQGALQETFVPEAVEVLDRWIERFFKNSWFRAVHGGTLTKEQYIYTLSNLHQFVRWTTRLIGRAVSYSNDRALRNKWLEHLEGEINHELIIEKDLAALGADVGYVVRSMVPNVPTQQFMVTQESMVGFHSDPVLFMGAPFVAEGFAAHLDQKFVEALRSNAKKWGVDNPKHVTAFFAGHVEFDGGDDGHWEHTRRLLGTSLLTNTDLQRFLNVVRLCTDAFDRAYSAYVDELAIFSATPANPGS